MQTFANPTYSSSHKVDILAGAFDWNMAVRVNSRELTASICNFFRTLAHESLFFQVRHVVMINARSIKVVG